MFDDRPMKGLLGSFLRAHRERLGLSQRALAAELDVSHVTVGEWERGTRTLPAKHRAALSDRLGIDPAVVRLVAIIDRQEVMNLSGHKHAGLAVAMVAQEHLCRLSKDQLNEVAALARSHGQE